jgi:hypothetical protein
MSIFVALFVSLSLQAAPDQARRADGWQPRRAEIEQCLPDAKVAKLEEVPIGVTKPSRAILQDSTCARAFAWKPLRPGMYSGYWESYKSEIAAYEVDKLLGLNMVPIAVPKPPAWPMQLVRMKMFDCLVGNTDRNKGNMLIDEAWNLYLIDHSRGFVKARRLPNASVFQNVDRALWQRMLTLDEATLKEHLGQWLDGAQIRSILERRDAMKKHIDALVAKHGDTIFFTP